MRASLVSTLAALALAAGGCGSGSKAGQPPACLGFGSSCVQAADCCSQICVGGTCLCNSIPGAKCSASTDCCPGQACTSGACAQGCRAVGDVCTYGSDCCSNACDATGHCAATCSSGACTTTPECCIGHYCALGSCQYGACGGSGDLCDTTSDCCQSPKHLTCSGNTCTCGAFASACASDADCCSQLVCSSGYCHPSPGSASDGQYCLANADCASGTCAGAAPPTPGACCTSGGGSCTVGSYTSLCCSPATCNDAAATGTFVCAACLNWTNSGTPAPGVAQCTRTDQCCSGQSLTCETSSGKCGKIDGTACSSAAECQSTANCSTRPGSTGAVCCPKFGSFCGGFDDCCDGLTCAQNQGYTGNFACHVAPGGICATDMDCAAGDNCLTGKCCAHSGSCTTGAECCSGVCTGGFCDFAPPYGQCQANYDCGSSTWGYAFPICGGNATVGANLCCPAPGDPCTNGQATCCETTDLCQAPLTAPTTAALCCRAYQAACTRDAECCTGVCGGTADGCCSPVGFTCTVAADCCGKGAVPPSENCQSGKCCFVTGVNAYGDATACCSGKVDGSGLCR
jgi:hypothetical protein